MTHLDSLEAESIYILRETAERFERPAVLWSMGKDSTCLLWLCRKAFLGRIPFPVLHIDTRYKFKNMIAFRDHWAREWGLDLRVARNERALAQGMNAQKGRLTCCTALKTEPLRAAIHQYRFDALILGIRRDEHGIRAKERFFSPRREDGRWDYQNQRGELWNLYLSQAPEDQHTRIHPLLSWREQDIWRYTMREKIPCVDLYFSQGRERYRSIGCETCCSAIRSTARTIPAILKELESSSESERSGRAQDKENAYAMQKLRSLGYM